MMAFTNFVNELVFYATSDLAVPDYLFKVVGKCSGKIKLFNASPISDPDCPFLIFEIEISELENLNNGVVDLPEGEYDLTLYDQTIIFNKDISLTNSVLSQNELIVRTDAKSMSFTVSSLTNTNSVHLNSADENVEHLDFSDNYNSLVTGNWSFMTLFKKGLLKRGEIIDKASGAVFSFFLEVSTTDTIIFTICNLDCTQVAAWETTEKVTNEDWNRFALIYDKRKDYTYRTSIFLNGTALTVNLTVLTGLPEIEANSQNIEMGQHFGGGAFWKGFFDEIILISKNISTTELKAIDDKYVTGKSADVLDVFNPEVWLRIDGSSNPNLANLGTGVGVTMISMEAGDITTDVL